MVNDQEALTSALADRPVERRRIVLVRHGHVDYFAPNGVPINPRDARLSEQGREQIDALAKVLEPCPIDIALTSPMLRTRETVALLLRHRSITIFEEQRFSEVRAGRLRELPAERREAEIAYAYDTAYEAGARFIGGEEWDRFRARVVPALEELLDRTDWFTALIVAHDAVNRSILAWALSAPGTERALEQDPGCVNVIDVDGTAGTTPRRKLIRAHNVTVLDPVKHNIKWTSMEQIYRGWHPHAR